LLNFIQYATTTFLKNLVCYGFSFYLTIKRFNGEFLRIEQAVSMINGNAGLM